MPLASSYPANRNWPAIASSPRDLCVFALSLHIQALNWIDNDRVACAWPDCSNVLIAEHILNPSLQGHCPGCADRLGFPIMPPF